MAFSWLINGGDTNQLLIGMTTPPWTRDRRYAEVVEEGSMDLPTLGRSDQARNVSRRILEVKTERFPTKTTKKR